jgi:hypothetical protein
MRFEMGRLDLLWRSLAVNHGKMLPHLHGLVQSRWPSSFVEDAGLLSKSNLRVTDTETSLSRLEPR